MDNWIFDPLSYEDENEIVHTQGGGTAKWDPYNKRYIFIDPPSNFPDFKAGDFVPENWRVQ